MSFASSYKLRIADHTYEAKLEEKQEGGVSTLRVKSKVLDVFLTLPKDDLSLGAFGKFESKEAINFEKGKVTAAFEIGDDDIVTSITLSVTQAFKGSRPVLLSQATTSMNQWTIRRA